MTRPTWWRPPCTCGHGQGDHSSGGTRFPHPLKFGVCLVSDCDCREYVAVPDDEQAAA
jgi:hypothetical protein